MAGLQQLKDKTSKELTENQYDNMLEQNCDNQMEVDNSSIVKDLSHTLVTKVESSLSTSETCARTESRKQRTFISLRCRSNDQLWAEASI